MVKKALQIVEKLDRRLWDGHLTDEQKVTTSQEGDHVSMNGCLKGGNCDWQ